MEKTSVAIQHIKASGMRVTKQRRDLINYLGLYSDSYIPVTEIDDHMRTLYPGISHDTIYRNVKEFESLGILEEADHDEQATVKLQCDFEHPHHHHFICTQCHRVQELEMCPLDFFENQIPGAKIESHNFELYGVCATCNHKK